MKKRKIRRKMETADKDDDVLDKFPFVLMRYCFRGSIIKDADNIIMLVEGGDQVYPKYILIGKFESLKDTPSSYNKKYIDLLLDVIYETKRDRMWYRTYPNVLVEFDIEKLEKATPDSSNLHVLMLRHKKYPSKYRILYGRIEKVIPFRKFDINHHLYKNINLGKLKRKIIIT